MIGIRAVVIVLAVIAALAAGCGVNSVSRSQLEAVKPGDVLVYRFKKGDKTWFYSDLITRVEGDTLYFHPSRKEATSGREPSLREFDRSRELLIKKAALLEYATEQGADKKVVIWINP